MAWIRTCTFGDLDAGLWGIACAPIGDRAGVAHVGRLGNARGTRFEVGFERSGVDQAWRLRAAGLELELLPCGGSGHIAIAEQGVEAARELCRVHGQLELDGVEVELDSCGQHGTRSGPADLERVESLREVEAWFGPRDGLMLVSLRPRGSPGHDRDLLSAALFEAGNPVAVADPRLSTTYTSAGLPMRAGLELWLGAAEEEVFGAAAEEVADGSAAEDERDSADQRRGLDADDAVPRHFPRRAAGEGTGATAQLAVAGFDVHAELFRWHMGSRNGAGVYTIARPA